MSEHRTLENLNGQIEKDPNNPNLYSLRAYHFFKNNDYEKAIKDLSKAISLTPEDNLERKASLLTSRGEIYMGSGDTISAIQDFTESIAKNGGAFKDLLHRTFNLRGDVYRGLGNVKKANKCFTNAIKIAKKISKDNNFPSREEKEEHDSKLAEYYFSRGRCRSLFPPENKTMSLSLHDFDTAISFLSNKKSMLLECYKEKCEVHEKLRKTKNQLSVGYHKDLSFLIKNCEKNEKFPYLIKRIKFSSKYLFNQEDRCEALNDIGQLFSFYFEKLNEVQKRSIRFIRARIYKRDKDFKKCLRDLDTLIKNSSTASQEEIIKYYRFRGFVHITTKKPKLGISDYNECINILTKNKSDSNWRERCHKFKKKIGDFYFNQEDNSKAVDEYSYYFDQLETSELFGKDVDDNINNNWSVYAKDLKNFGIILLKHKKYDDLLEQEEEEEDNHGNTIMRKITSCVDQAEKVFSKLINKSENFIKYFSNVDYVICLE